MIVYACMCEQMLDCEYVIILKSCVGAMQFSSLWWTALTFVENISGFPVHDANFWHSDHWVNDSGSISLQPKFEKQYQSCMLLWWACQKTKCTALWFYARPKLSKATLLRSQALVTIIQPIPSLSPLSNTQCPREEQTSFNVKHCVKSKISLIILSKWNVCLCSFSVILLTVRADCETKF